jgi:dihydroxyacetone kinase
LIVKNYTGTLLDDFLDVILIFWIGDKLNFGLAAEVARTEGFKVSSHATFLI